ncbi:MAG TPA: DUF929 family protein [Gryllotalpicola sp.]
MARSQRTVRSRRVLLQIVVAAVVLAVAAAVVLTVSLRPKPSSHPAPGSSPAAVDVSAAIRSVPASVFDQIGAGTAQTAPTKVDAPALTQGGTPLVLYAGGEFCPFCAAERWPLAVALSRFGTFSGLGQTSSADAPEVYPDTATLSFHGASYASEVLALSAKELSDREHKPLDELTAAEQKVVDGYDAPPYTQQSGTIPFVDIGGGWLIHGAEYDPAVLKGTTHAQIAQALTDPSSPIAQAVIGSANVITVALCDQTGGQPASVCTSSGVTTAAAAMAQQKQQ